MLKLRGQGPRRRLYRARAVDQKRQRPRHRRLAALAQDVCRHRAVGDARKPGGKAPPAARRHRCSRDRSCAARLAQARQDVSASGTSHSRRARTTPHRGSVVGDLDERRPARRRRRRNGRGEEALRMEEDLRRALADKARAPAPDLIRNLGRQPRSRRDDGDAQRPLLMTAAYGCSPLVRLIASAMIRTEPISSAAIGGSGMMPLALIVQAPAPRCRGSDRALDQGRTPEKFAFLRARGVILFPQDGSGVTGADHDRGLRRGRGDHPDVAAARRVGARDHDPRRAAGAAVQRGRRPASASPAPAASRPPPP